MLFDLICFTSLNLILKSRVKFLCMPYTIQLDITVKNNRAFSSLERSATSIKI
jgi:hypothetical protein